LQLLLATRNEHKRREFARLLAREADAHVRLLVLPAGVALPPEQGGTFAENALPKARAAAAASVVPTPRPRVVAPPPARPEPAPRASRPESSRRAGKVAKDVRELRRRLEDVERQIHQLEARLAEIGERLGDPAFYADGERVRAVAAERKSAEEQVTWLMREWEQLSTALAPHE